MPPAVPPSPPGHDLAPTEKTQYVALPVLLVDSFKGTVPKGFSGDAAAGSAEEGQAMTEAVVAILVPFLRELDARGWKRGTWMSRMED